MGPPCRVVYCPHLQFHTFCIYLPHSFPIFTHTGPSLPSIPSIYTFLPFPSTGLGWVLYTPFPFCIYPFTFLFYFVCSFIFICILPPSLPSPFTFPYRDFLTLFHIYTHITIFPFLSTHTHTTHTHFLYLFGFGSLHIPFGLHIWLIFTVLPTFTHGILHTLRFTCITPPPPPFVLPLHLLFSHTYTKTHTHIFI